MAATYSPTTRSTIGVAELNDPVRNGKGWDLSAITTLIFYRQKTAFAQRAKTGFASKTNYYCL